MEHAYICYNGYVYFFIFSWCEGMKENEGQEGNNTHNSTPIIDDVKDVCAGEGIKAPHATNTPTI